MTASLLEKPGSVASLARRILEPLCEETAKFLRPVKLSEYDRLHVTLDADKNGAEFFVVQAYAKVPTPVDQKIEKVVAAYIRGEPGDDAVKLTLSAFGNITIPDTMTFGQWVEAWKLERDRRTQATAASNAATNAWILCVPEREDLGGRRWRLAATDVTALVMNANWEDERLEWGDADAEQRYRYLLVRFLEQTVASQKRALFKIKGVLPELPADWVDNENKPLAGYQKVGVVGCVDQEASALFMEQGTGKTPVAIQRVMIESERKFHVEHEAVRTTGRKKRNLYRVLVVCPKNVRANWANELNEFATYPGKIAVLRGGALKRQQLMIETILADDDDSRYGICVCSYEAVSRSWDQLRMVPWDLVIADESHYMKSVRRNRGQQMLELRGISDQRMCLTGSPVCNSLLDLYMQLEFLAPGMSGFSTWKAFKDFYGSFEKKGNSQYEKLTGYQNLPFLQERLARIAFMITKKEAMPDLPEKTYTTRYFDFTSKQRDWYTRMAEQLAMEIEAGGAKMTAANILVKLLRLAQIAGGYASWDAEIDPDTGDVIGAPKIEYLDPNPMINEFIDYVKETPEDSKVIAWACFIPFIDRLSERMTAEGIPHVTYTGSTKDDQRETNVNRFNKVHARECKVFLGNPAAGGTGINVRGYDPDAEFDHGCNVTDVAYLLQNWSHAHRVQSEDRAHRRGTRTNVRYTTFLAEGSILETIHDRLTKKKVNAFTIQDVREIMAQVLNSLPIAEDDED